MRGEFGLVFCLMLVLLAGLMAQNVLAEAQGERRLIKEVKPKAKVVVNEVEFNPPEGQATWVELYNPGDKPVKLSGWMLVNYRLQVFELPEDAQISGKGFYVALPPKNWLNPEGDIVILLDSRGVEVDRTPLLRDTAGDSKTWQRVYDGADTETEADWKFTENTIYTSNGKGEVVSIWPFQPRYWFAKTPYPLLGNIRPEREDVTVTVKIETLGMRGEKFLVELSQVTTDVNGTWVYRWTPESAGFYYVRAYAGEASSQEFKIQVVRPDTTPQPSTITLSQAQKELYFGSKVKLTGILNPPRENVAVLLLYKYIGFPETYARGTLTFPDGRFFFILNPERFAVIQVRAFWIGDPVTVGSTSQLLHLILVKPSLTVKVNPENAVSELKILSGPGISKPLTVKLKNGTVSLRLNSTGTCILSLPELIPLTGNFRLKFEAWIRNGEKVSAEPTAEIKVEGSETVEAHYAREHLLTVKSELGEVLGGGWYKEGSKATITVKPTETGFLIRKVFRGWSGDYTGEEPTATITMDKPKTVTAVWETDFTQLYIVLAALTIACIISVAITKTRKKSQTRLNPKNLKN